MVVHVVGVFLRVLRMRRGDHGKHSVLPVTKLIDYVVTKLNR